jgi:hypothetical protein
MQQTPQPLFDSEQFTRRTSVLKDALQSLSKPSFLLLEPNILPNGWEAEIKPLSVLELLNVSSNAIQSHSTRWKSSYFTQMGTGFHSVEFKNRGGGKRYIVTAQTDAATAITSTKDAKEFIIQKDSPEHRDILGYINKQLCPVPAVTPTNSESTSQFFDESPLRINANTSKHECGITPNCITPSSNNIEDSFVPNGFFSSFDAEPEVKAALKTLYEYVNSVQGPIPKQIQAFVYTAMMKCDNRDLKNHIYTIKQCSAPSSQLRYYDRHFQFIPVAQSVSKKANTTNVNTTKANATKANAIKAQLDISVGNDLHQRREIMERLQARLGLESEKADASTQTVQLDDDSTQTVQLGTPMATLQTQPRKYRNFWTSKNAHKLFLYGVHKADEEKKDGANAHDILEAQEMEFDDDETNVEIFADLKCIVRKRIDRLRSAYTTATGYRDVLSEKWKKTPISDQIRFKIAQRSRYLVAALENALWKMPGLTWKECCQNAMEEVNASEGVDHITNHRTVENWHTSFRHDGYTFDALVDRAHDTRMPKFLEENPEQKKLIIKYALDNLNQLTVQVVHNYIHNTLLPQMKEERVSELRKTLNEMENEEEKIAIQEEIDSTTVRSILEEYNLKVLNEETIRQWMHKLGFKYEERRKCFFVDNHE